jgi:DNA-binding response OmpR family regulator
MSGGSLARVLVVEDDDAVREAVAAALRGAGHDEVDGLGIDRAVHAFRPDLAILDVRLATGPSGLSIARRLRRDADIPIVFLTAADSVQDLLAGFDAGADDYLSKPFAVAELLARVKALLRRSGALSSATWQVGDLVVDEEAWTAVRGDRTLELTRTEFDLLVALGAKPGRVLSKTQLLSTVWGVEVYDPNLVEVHVSSLRRKLEAEGQPRLVHTVRGAGYVLRVS